MEIPRHVHKRGGSGQGGESKIVSTLDELARAESEGWVVDPNAPIVSAADGERADRAASDALYPPVDDAPLPDVLDDPDGAPPADPDDADLEQAEDDKPKRGRPRKS